MEMLPHWSEGEKQAFLAQQFQAQSTFYAAQFPDASFDIVELDGEAVGRLYVDRREDEVRLIDIALVPECRDRGLGSELMAEILAEGELKGLLVRIHVEQNNPAMRLYRRLGFEKIEEQGVYWLMEWTPRSQSHLLDSHESATRNEEIAMSEEPQEGQIVESGMSAEEMAALSEPGETEGEIPESTKQYGNVSIDDAGDSYQDADKQADDREEVPTEASEEE